MAFDGIMIHALLHELNTKLIGARIAKINQPEKEELFLTFKGSTGKYSLLISANGSLPLIYLTEESKKNPLTAPNFCMLLRKHIGNGKIISITQPGLERILDIQIEHLDELGDLSTKHLIFELMGKHSNLIFTDENYRIVDSIKRVPPYLSSVRIVLPGALYERTNTQNKLNPFTVTHAQFLEHLSPTDTLQQAFSKTYEGISTQSANEFLFEYQLNGDTFVSSLSDSEKDGLAKAFSKYIQKIENMEFQPTLVSNEKQVPIAFSAMDLPSYRLLPNLSFRNFDSVSSLLETYYQRKNLYTNMHQRSADLRKLVETLLGRTTKKLELQKKQFEDTKKKDRYRLYGELLKAYAYMIKEVTPTVVLTDYTTNREVSIPMDPQKTVFENSAAYFNKYAKLKRTQEALSHLILETKQQLDSLTSIQLSIELSESIEDLNCIRKELTDLNFMKRSSQKKGSKITLAEKPLHYVTPEGFHLYVGKNNIQNEYVTFKIAENQDIFFHVKNAPGSHVILKTEGKEIPDSVYETAGNLAAYYSSLSQTDKVEIDYTRKKHVKRPANGPLGLVIYHTNYSMMAKPDISGLSLV